MRVLGDMILQNSLVGSGLILMILLFRTVTRNFSRIYVHTLWLLLLAVLLLPPLQRGSLHTARNLIQSQELLNVMELRKGTGDVSGERDTVLRKNSDTEQIPESEELVSTKEPSKEALSLLPKESARTEVLARIWASGAGILAVLHMLQWMRLKRKVATACREEGNVWRTDEVRAPFVLPGFPSRIYIPFGLQGGTLEDVLVHERMHIRYGDPWIKCLAAGVLVLHWFNPLVWLAFRLMGQDMEQLCDERVLRGKSMEEKKRYSRTLLQFAYRKNSFSPAIHFGESRTKNRIHHILFAKKPHLLLSILLFVLIGGCGLSFLTEGEREAVEEQQETVNEPEDEEISENVPEEEVHWTAKPVVGTGRSGADPQIDPASMDMTGETESFAFYSVHEGEAFAVQTPDCLVYAEVPVLSNYEILPLINEADYDGDGESELAAVTTVLHGTGVMVDSLFMVDRSNDGSWNIYQYLDSAYLDTLTPHFTTVYEGEKARLSFDGEPVGVSEPLEQEYLDNHYAYYAGSQIDFRLVEDKIQIRAELAGYSDIHFAGNFVGHEIDANVSYEGEGSFGLTELRYADANINDCVEHGLTLYLTGELLDSYIMADGYELQRYTEPAEEITILSMTYPVKDLDSGKAEVYAAIRKDQEDSLLYATVFLFWEETETGDMDWQIQDIWLER